MKRALLVLFFMAVPIAAQQREAISVCDLTASAEAYEGQVVTVRGTYASGFEHAFLAGDRCNDRQVWINFDANTERATSPRVYRRWVRTFDSVHTPSCDNTDSFSDTRVDVTFIGTLELPKTDIIFGRKIRRTFGHLGAYDYQFNVTSIERVGRKREQTSDWFEDPPGTYTLRCSVTNSLPL